MSIFFYSRYQQLNESLNEFDTHGDPNVDSLYTEDGVRNVIAGDKLSQVTVRPPRAATIDNSARRCGPWSAAARARVWPRVASLLDLRHIPCPLHHLHLSPPSLFLHSHLFHHSTHPSLLSSLFYSSSLSFPPFLPLSSIFPFPSLSHLPSISFLLFSSSLLHHHYSPPYTSFPPSGFLSHSRSFIFSFIYPPITPRTSSSSSSFLT